MFARLGRFAARFRWYIVVAWLAAAVLLTLFAPNIDQVSVNDQRAFLPASTPSLEAAGILRESFPERSTASSAVAVVDAGPGGNVAEGASWTWIGTFTAWLEGAEQPSVIKRVVSPTTADAQTAKALISPDGQIALVVISFEKGGAERQTSQALDAISTHLAGAPAGTRVYLTGDAAILHEYNTAANSSMDSTTWITILLVVLILLLVYRSPVSPAVPLLTIGTAYIISRGAVAILGDTIMTISGYTNVFLIVVLFGAGTDYCLFLISRFREELAGTQQPAAAISRTVQTVGETISSSAGTVVVGLATMGLAELGLFNTSGPSLAVGVLIALAAGLTLTPALLAILGHRTFWPRKAHLMKESTLWQRWSASVTRRPLVALLVTVAVLVPLAVYGLGINQDFDLLADLSNKSPARQGFAALSDHMGPGAMQPLTIVVKDPGGFTGPQGLAHMERLQQQLQSVEDVAQVRSLVSVLAGTDTLSVTKQLADQAQTVRDGIAQLEQMQGSGQANQAAVKTAVNGLLDLYGYVRQLGAEFPEVMGDPGYQQSLGVFTSLVEAFGLSPAMLAAAGSVSAVDLTAFSLPPGGLPSQVPTALNNLADSFDSLSSTFATWDNATMLPDAYVKNNQGLNALKSAYVSEDGTAARMQVTLGSGPYAKESMAAVEDLRRIVAADGPGGGVEGSSAIITDLATSSSRDMTRAIVSVLIGIFLVLILLLRSLVAPLYLILTILLSYGATLGVVRVLFVDVIGAAGVTWWVPTFMFVMLVALGMDYNIFLMGRVKEEVRRSGNRDGVRTAVAKTGGIITSAGIIMAGTFAAMLSADILGLVQIAFAVTFGVLLDTFVVRTALVPAICVLLGRWNWWPRKNA